MGEIDAGSRGVAGALRAWGIEAGDRCAVMMGNVPEFIPCWFGILRAGAIEVPVHSAHRGPLLEHILAESGARILFCDAEFVPRLAAWSCRRWSGSWSAARSSGAGAGPADRTLDEALAAPPGAPRCRASRSPTSSCILYTSGTTGPLEGRGAQPHGANLQLARANVALMEYTADDVLYTAFPLFHVNAKFTLGAPRRCYAAATAGAATSASAPRASGTDAARRASPSFNYMGALLTILHKQPPEARRPRPRGGRGLRRRLRRRRSSGAFEERFGVRLHERLRDDRDRHRHPATPCTSPPVGSIGVRRAALRGAVADEHDVEVPVGEVGEIQVGPASPT